MHVRRRSVGQELPALDVSLVLGHPILSALVLAALILVGRRLVRALRGALRQGMAILSSPRRFLVGVASWQALARLIRLGSMAAFMAALGAAGATALASSLMFVKSLRASSKQGPCLCHDGGNASNFAPVSASPR